MNGNERRGGERSVARELGGQLRQRDRPRLRAVNEFRHRVLGDGAGVGALEDGGSDVAVELDLSEFHRSRFRVFRFQVSAC